MQVTVKYADGRTEEVTPTPYNLVAFERHFKIGASAMDRFEHEMWVVWHRLHQIGTETREFDDFLADVADLVEEEAPLAPPPPPPD
jgi:hypothetical protein